MQRPTITIHIGITTIIGVNPHERVTPQPINICLELYKSSDAKELEKNLLKLVQDYTKNHQPNLLETMVYELSLRLGELGSLGKFSLTIKKPQAFLEAAYSYVNISGLN